MFGIKNMPKKFLFIHSILPAKLDGPPSLLGILKLLLDPPGILLKPDGLKLSSALLFVGDTATSPDMLEFL